MSGVLQPQQPTPQAPLSNATLPGLLAFLQILRARAANQPFQQPLGAQGLPQVSDAAMQPPVAQAVGPNIGGLRPTFRSTSI